jgi:hypothetical protein
LRIYISTYKLYFCSFSHTFGHSSVFVCIHMWIYKTYIRRHTFMHTWYKYTYHMYDIRTYYTYIHTCAHTHTHWPAPFLEVVTLTQLPIIFFCFSLWPSIYILSYLYFATSARRASINKEQNFALCRYLVLKSKLFSSVAMTSIWKQRFRWIDRYEWYSPYRVKLRVWAHVYYPDEQGEVINLGLEWVLARTLTKR